MRMTRSLGGVLERFGISVKRARHQTPARRALFLKQEGITLVFDVGAHVGDYGQELRRHGFKGRIEAFEPNPVSFTELQKRSAGDPSWNVRQVGLGDAKGDMELHVAANQVSSSLLAMHHNHVEAAPESRYVESRTIEVARLDDLSLAATDDAVLMKLDTQGYERQVLEGAAGTLGKVRLIEMEMSLRPLYEGQMLLPEALALLGDLGFSLIWVERVRFTDSRMRLLQLDGIFARAA